MVMIGAMLTHQGEVTMVSLYVGGTRNYLRYGSASARFVERPIMP